MRPFITLFLISTLFSCTDIHKEYYSNGVIKSEIEYIEKIPNGVYKKYDRKGNLIEKGNFLNGKMNGICIWYYDNGFIDTKAEYLNGVENGTITKYNKAGILQDSGRMINGKQEGLTYRFFPNGKLNIIQEYHNDTSNGIFKEYYLNESLLMYAKITKGITNYYVKYDSLGNFIKENSDCSECDSNNILQYKPKILIFNKDYLTFDKIPNSCLRLSVTKGYVSTTDKPGVYNVKIYKQKHSINKVIFAVTIQCDTTYYCLGLIEKEVRLK